MKKILVVEDDKYLCDLLVDFLDKNGFETIGTETGLEAKKMLNKQEIDVVVCDFRLPDTTGSEMLKYVQGRFPQIPVIIITAYANIKQAVELIKSGAFDYITKPLQHEEIRDVIANAAKLRKAKKLKDPFGKGFVSGKSQKIKKVLDQVLLVAPTELPVLIEGETGSGKEYIARAIHKASHRRGHPFIPVDCGAIPKDLANSELFGHVKGAFTGAVSDKTGHFEQAKGGTIFLDEVANLPPENQMKLLRALQERVIYRFVDNKMIRIDVRIISASNEDLIQQLREGGFREDLYFRLNGFKLRIPPLRERKEDILVFVRFFVKQANKAFEKNVSVIEKSARQLLLEYPWYGNIRELQNVINRAVLLSKSDKLSPDDFPPEIRYAMTENRSKECYSSKRKLSNPSNLKESIINTEKEMIVNALREANYNKSRAAKLLKIDRKTLYNKINLYNINIIR